MGIYAQKIEIPNSVTTLGEDAISYRDALVEITIPNSIINITGNPFFQNERLSQFNVSDDHPFLETIDGVLFDKQEKSLSLILMHFLTQAVLYRKKPRALFAGPLSDAKL